jgi:hypothetical protein
VQPVLHLTISAVQLFCHISNLFLFFILLMNSETTKRQHTATACQSIGMTTLSTSAPRMGTMSHPEREEAPEHPEGEEEDVPSEDDETEEEVPGAPGQTQLPLPPLLGEFGEPQYLEPPRRSPRKKKKLLFIFLRSQQK